MKQLLSFLILLIIAFNCFAQLKVPPDGGNKKAWVGEQIGVTDVTIHYDRPAVKGREGQIWGKLVLYGFNDLGFGTSKQAPWRAGANENTVISFSTDVKIEGQALKAGDYGFFIAVAPEKCTLIFSANHSSWGSYFYDPKEDVLRVEVKQEMLTTATEFLQYSFSNQTPNSAVVNLMWEKWRIPFTVETDLIPLQLASFRKELRGEKSFNPGWAAWQQAAQFCLQNKVNLQEGLQWADMATSGVFIGEANFSTLSTRAGILQELGRTDEATKQMQQALPMGNANQVHAYARQLQQQKRTAEAIAIFKANYTKFPNTFTTTMGMVRAMSLGSDLKKALSFAEKALPLASDDMNKLNVENIIKQLKEGKDINQ
jgi:tetratricopeptide (TPR) repeat protein